ncbi:MAG: GGDEF domain-containing protein [Eggerthella lenta]
MFAYDRDGDRLIEVDDPATSCGTRTIRVSTAVARCLTMQDAVFKIEYLDGRVLHVTSVPMDIEGAELVLELIKDVTDSLLVADIEVRDNIEITQMITKFNELAVRDGFTKLYNKTFINNELESLVQAARGGSPAGEAAVVLLDIDGFKQINDTYGHIAGDDALQYFASKMRSFRTLFRRVGRTFRRR